MALFVINIPMTLNLRRFFANLARDTFSFITGFAAILLTFLANANAEEAIDISMITAINGNVSLVTPQGRQPLQAFAKLKRGDLLALDNASIRLIYFESGRQESWRGTGRLETLSDAGRAFGLPNPDVKILSKTVVSQIARTPAPDRQGRIEAKRLRVIATPEAIAKLDNAYRQMRMEAVRGDLNPELYLLSGLFEMREFDRVEQVLVDLQKSRPGDMEVGLMVALYQKAIRNSRESQGR